jgi:mannose-6-phosphate isomerase
VVAAGPYQGSALSDLLRSHREAVVGATGPSAGAFPLLVKLLDAREPLSVQLHPGDRQAEELEGKGEGKGGKTEAWIILAAEPGAEIIHGLAPGTVLEKLCARLEALRGDRLSPAEERAFYRRVTVQAGDVVFVPAGTVHALGGGLVLAEVQQSSDITYRLYDWGRRDERGRGRELHVDKARRVRQPEAVPCPFARLPIGPGPAAFLRLLSCEQFHLDYLSLPQGGVHRASTAARGVMSFHILMGWGGTLSYRGPRGDCLEVPPLRFVLLPAALGAYELVAGGGPGQCVVIGAGSGKLEA